MSEPMNPNQIKCPHCGQTYAVQPEQWAQYSGRTINCTRCGQTFTVAGQQGAHQQQQPPPMPVAPNYGQAPPYPPAAPPYQGMQPQPGGYPGLSYSNQTATTSGFAIWSLVCGFLGFCLPIPSSILAIIFGIIGLNKTRDQRVGGKGMAIAGICLGGFTLLMIPLMISILLPSLNRAREQANRVKCASNMRQIGQTIAMYANSNANQFPDKLEDLVKFDPSLSLTVFVCPTDTKLPPSNAQQIASGSNCSYVYVGKGLTASAAPNVVVLYEPVTNHAGEGMNVLFADFHVEWLTKSEAKTILDQQSAGTQPIKYPAGP
jgi:predicted Zn finger-like uncharacterized protein/prepilin-type processing-associated H-X9-DG protein